MVNFLDVKIFSLIEKLRDLDKELSEFKVERDVHHDIDEIKNKLFYYNLLGLDRTVITSVVGPQGTGKSTFVNALLNLQSPGRQLPTGEGRQEHIPVILRDVSWREGQKEEFHFYRERKDTPYKIDVDIIPLEQGWERVIYPFPEDLIAVAYIDNPNIRVYGQLLVSPGLELDNRRLYITLKSILDISDVIIYVNDNTRIAQSYSQIIETWIKEKEISSTPIVVITKSDRMSNEEIKGIRSSIEDYFKDGVYSIHFVGKGDNYKKEFDSIREEIVSTIAHIFPSSTQVKYKYLKEILYDISDVMDRIKQSMVTRGTRRPLFVDEIIEDLSNIWEKYLQNELKEAFNRELSDRVENANQVLDKKIREIFSTLGKIKIVLFTGGVTYQQIRPVEREIEDVLLREFSGLENKLPLPSNIIDPQIKMFYLPMRQMFLAPPRVDTMVISPTKTFVEIASDVMKVDRVISDSYLKNLSNIRKRSLTYSLETIKEYQEFRKKLKKQITGDALRTGIIAISGIGEILLEITGGGLQGAALSIIGGSVAAAATIGSITSHVIRSANKAELETRNYFYNFINGLVEQLEEEFDKKLSLFWDKAIWRIERELLGSTGVSQEKYRAYQVYKIIEQILEITKGIMEKLP